MLLASLLTCRLNVLPALPPPLVLKALWLVGAGLAWNWCCCCCGCGCVWCEVNAPALPLPLPPGKDARNALPALPPPREVNGENAAPLVAMEGAEAEEAARKEEVRGNLGAIAPWKNGEAVEGANMLGADAETGAGERALNDGRCSC